MSQCMRFQTMWYVWPAKTQISLRICAIWSEPLLVADWTLFGVSKLKRRLHRLIWVYKVPPVSLQLAIAQSQHSTTLSHCAPPYSSNKTIRICHECEGRIEKSVLRITVWHHEACRVMTIGDPEGRIFLSYPHTNNRLFFLLTTVFFLLF